VKKSEDLTIDNYVFEKAQNFKYSRVTTTGTPKLPMVCSKRKGPFCTHKVIQVKTILYRNKVHLSMSIAMLTYDGCEVWTMTVQIEQKP